MNRDIRRGSRKKKKRRVKQGIMRESEKKWSNNLGRRVKNKKEGTGGKQTGEKIGRKKGE